jgi:hypothetical protein
LKTIILAVIAASLTHLACAAPSAPPPVLPAEVALAINYLQQELDARIDKAKSAHLDQPSGNRYSDAQQAAARAVFGADAPFTVKPLPPKGSNAQYALRIPGHTYSAGGAQGIWPDLDLQLSVSRDGRKLDGKGTWDGIDIEGKDYTVAFHGIGFALNQTRAPAGGWTGKVRVDADSIVLTNPADALMNVRAAQSTFSSEISRQGKQHPAYEFSTRRLSLGGAEIDEFHMAYRLHNLNGAVIAAYQRALMTGPAQKTLDDAAKQLLVRGASLDIEDISATFGGGKIRLNGTIAMPTATEADLISAERMLNKLEAHFTIRLPLTSFRAMVYQFQKNSADGEAKAQDIYELGLGKLLANGYANLEKDTLVSRIDIGNGEVSINGGAKKLSLKTLLEMLNAPDPTPPPKDDTPPALVTWADRSLESLLLFGGNKDRFAVHALCQRYSSGAAKDEAEALKWCPLADEHERVELQWREKAKEPAPTTNKLTMPTPSSPTQRMFVQAGYFEEVFFRFDDTKTRSLMLLLEEPQPHEKWAPMLGVCLTAEAPSDVVCLDFLREDPDSDQLAVRTRTLSADRQSSKDGHYLDRTFTVGEKIHLQVFVRGEKVFFQINGKHLMTNDLLFQPQLIKLFCSTAACNTTFD